MLKRKPLKKKGLGRLGSLTKPRKRRKKSQLSKLKEKTEALQKRVVIKLYGEKCYTHPPTAMYTNTRQLGHMPWARAELSQTCIYDHRFTRIQCGYCNGFGQGMSMTAKERMIEEGIDLDELWALNIATKGKTHTKEFYLSKITEYQSILATLWYSYLSY